MIDVNVSMLCGGPNACPISWTSTENRSGPRHCCRGRTRCRCSHVRPEVGVSDREFGVFGSDRLDVESTNPDVLRLSPIGAIEPSSSTMDFARSALDLQECRGRRSGAVTKRSALMETNAAAKHGYDFGRLELAIVVNGVLKRMDMNDPQTRNWRCASGRITTSTLFQ